MRRFAGALTLWLIVGCDSPAPAPPATGSTIALTEIRPGTPLDEMLQQLEQELLLAWTGRLEPGAAANHFRRAEAITDRLLEASLPFEWLASERYSLQARLRQIQSEADRIMAQSQTGATTDALLDELRRLRVEVARLRAAIGRGGGRAPAPLQLLLTDSVETPRRAAPAPSTTPTNPDTTGGG